MSTSKCPLFLFFVRCATFAVTRSAAHCPLGFKIPPPPLLSSHLYPFPFYNPSFRFIFQIIFPVSTKHLYSTKLTIPDFCQTCKVVHYCSVKCQKEYWKADHKKHTIAHKTKIVPLPKPIPKVREKFLKGECDPICKTLINHSPGKGRPIFSVGAGACAFVNGKPVPNPPKGLNAADVYKLLIDTYRLRAVQEQKDNEKPEYPEDLIKGCKAFKVSNNKRVLLPGW
ncbi:zinc finger MYND domain-containing protein [Aspergillus ruber CBS 135680]|uniref:MYND-type domain-containing protein n=1 Tax=Aspergillus ruber (strain CBS 135680) TaxID=1388766 RepID=A0A017S0W4_ASPRC|nr:uncharacterized protein EURHEDRAFT_406718 [Aspergillus ruber CBS 135680]EYE90678.1 hypothetical protein EURHEDRAFT_406718 [Aspergillus ruber CBS 135680]